MATKTVTTAKTALDIEWLQHLDQGLILANDDLGLTITDDDITLVTADGESFAGCYVYQVSDDKVFIGVC